MLTSLWPFLALAADVIVRTTLIVFILLRRHTRSASTLAWIVLIVAIPVVGVLGYLLLGEVRLSRGRIARHAEIIERLHATLRAAPPSPAVMYPVIDPAHRPIATLADAVSGNPPLGGNHIQLIADTDLFVESLVMDIDAAQAHCHVLSYIFLDDGSGQRVARALAAAARRGVPCRLLVDAVGSRGFGGSALRREIAAAGVDVVLALPVNPARALLARLDVRNHRKIAVIDGRTAYVGSQNIADAAFAPKPKFAPWVDATARIRGPAAQQAAMLFAEDWFLDTGETLDAALDVDIVAETDGVAAQVMGTGPNAFNEALRQLNLTALHMAREELMMTTPYFVPDDATAMALRTAARRGIDTYLIVPQRNDSPLVAAASRSHYERLLDAGVRIFEYERGLLHAKTMTIDRSLAMITSANLDRRSFELNFEVSMVVYDSDFASQLRFLQTSYLAESRPIDRAQWSRRRMTSRLLQNAAGTLSPLL